MHKKTALLLLAILVLPTLFVSCRGKEEHAAEPDPFRFVVYPGARYLGQLTETTKQAHRVLNPAQEPPPIAMYDSEAALEAVADYYVKEYGFGQVAPQPPADPNAADKPPAYYRSGDLQADIQAVAELIRKMNLPTDTSKAVGSYRAAEITGRVNRPRVTLQRPYFDSTTSQVVDRTLILMSR